VGACIKGGISTKELVNERPVAKMEPVIPIAWAMRKGAGRALSYIFMVDPNIGFES